MKQLPVYVINMSSSQERMERFNKRAKDAGIDYHRVEAIDGNATEGWSLFHFEPDAGHRVFRYRHKEISSIELCCTASHLKAIKRAFDDGCEYALICEDDAIISSNTMSEITAVTAKAPSGWTILQLCINLNGDNSILSNFRDKENRLFARKSHTNPVRSCAPNLSSVSIHGAVAYLINRSGMKNVVQRIDVNGKIIIPCAKSDAKHNNELIADCLTYRFASGDCAGAWAVTLPIVSYEGLDSTIHPDHLASHFNNKQIALEVREEAINNNQSIQATIAKLGSDFRADVDRQAHFAISAFLENKPQLFIQANNWITSLHAAGALEKADVFLHIKNDVPENIVQYFSARGVHVVKVPGHFLSHTIPNNMLAQLKTGALSGYDFSLISELDTFFIKAPFNQACPNTIIGTLQKRSQLPPMKLNQIWEAAGQKHYGNNGLPFFDSGLYSIPASYYEPLRLGLNKWSVFLGDTTSLLEPFPKLTEQVALALTINEISLPFKHFDIYHNFPTMFTAHSKEEIKSLSQDEIKVLRYRDNIDTSGKLLLTGIDWVDKTIVKANNLTSNQPRLPIN